jgi:hypothetical protein
MYKFVLIPLGLSEMVSNVAEIIFLFLPAICYHLLMEVFLNGQSVGKRMLNIQVLDRNGAEASLSQYMLRWVFRLIDMGFTMGIGAVMSTALTQNSQRLGDLVAGTIIIDKKYNTYLEDTIFLDIADKEYKPMFPEVMKLTDRDINGIRNLLDIKKVNRETDIYTAQIAHRIKEVLHITSDMQPADLLHQLLRDYNFLTRK